MLIILIIIPICGIIIVSIINSNNNNSIIQIKKITLFTIIINFIFSILIWINFDSNILDYQFTQLFNHFYFYQFYIGIDGISIYFILITTFLIPICIISNWNNINYNIKYYLIIFLILESFLIIVFIVLDIIIFYIFFESVLIPLFLIIGIWGGNQIRIRAAFLLFVYTLIGSLFILLSFIIISVIIGSTDYQIISLINIDFEYQKYIWIGIFISIAIKTPLFPVHIWLPKAHVEAPLGGSIILAGIILKLATYGYLRILLQFLPEASYYFSPFVQIISVITIIYASFITLRQTDFKAFVAYSSIAHIGVIVLGLFSNTIQGIEGAILLSIGHAFISPALFILVGGVLYDRYYTRTISYYRGIVNYMPLFSIFYFIFTISNAAVPLSVNFLGEYLCLTGIFQINPMISIIASLGIVLSAAYSIWIYNRITFGPFSIYMSYTQDINRREFHILFILFFLTLFLGIFPNIVLDTLHLSVSILIYNSQSLLNIYII